MKRIFFLSLAMCLATLNYAHLYLQKGLAWQLTCGVAMGTNVITEDTVFDGKNYLIVPYTGYFRDDSTGLYSYTPACNREYLIFPYGAQLGDTIRVSDIGYLAAKSGTCEPNEYGGFIVSPGCGSYTGVVTEIDTIQLLNGEQRRIVYYQGGYWRGLSWYIEGIGGPQGLLCENLDWEASYGDMLCCYVGSTLLWTRNDCEQWTARYPNACLNDKPKTADTWHALAYKWYLVINPSEFINVQYNLTTDTVIGEYTYRKLIRDNTTCVGGLRQTDDGMKVYYYDMASPSNYPFSHVDCLLYDFTANVGDTIKDAYFRYEDFFTDAFGPLNSIEWHVVEKDTIDGRIHMTVARYDSLGYEDYTVGRTRWIQGIGTSNVLWPNNYGLADLMGFNTLYTLCATHGDECLYSYELPNILGIVNNCSEWHFTGVNDTPADDSRSRKVLRDGHLHILLPNGTRYDATGKLVE